MLISLKAKWVDEWMNQQMSVFAAGVPWAKASEKAPEDKPVRIHAR